MHRCQLWVNVVFGFVLLYAALLPQPVQAQNRVAGAMETGIALLKDIFPGSAGSNITSAIAFGSRVFFIADDGVHGLEPWISNGTAAGTVLLKDTNPGAGEVFVHDGQVTPPVVWKSKVYFVGMALNPSNNQMIPQLWVSDGTAAGTHAVSDVYHPIYELKAGVSGVSFRDEYPNIGASIGWSTGTAATTYMIHNWRANDRAAYPFLEMNNFVYAVDPAGKLWKINPSTKQEVQLDSANPNSTELAAVNGWLVYEKNNGVNGLELWETDGTKKQMLYDLSPGSASSAFDSRLTIGNRLFIAAVRSGTAPVALYVTKGGSTGLVQLSSAGSSVYFLTNAGSRLFYANVKNSIMTPWRSDGSRGSTVTLCSTCLHNGAFPVLSFASLAGSTIYTAVDAAGAELWISNGSDAGTHRLADLYRNADSSLPGQLVSMGTYLFFVANNGVNGREAYIYRPVTLTFKANKDTVTVNTANTLLNVLANDTKAAGTTLQLTGFDPLSRFGGAVKRDDRGTPANLADDRLVYNPKTGYVGQDELAYWISDGSGKVTIGRVTLQVNFANHPPTQVSYTSLIPGGVPENAAVGVQAGTLAVTDPDAGDSHTCQIVSANAPFRLSGLKVIVNAALDYETHKSGYVLSLHCSDAGGLAVDGTITVAVADGNEPPEFTTPLSILVTEDTPQYTLLTFTDPENDPGVITISVQPQHGTGSVQDCTGSACTLVYQPAPDYVGADTLTLTLADNRGAQVQAAAAITVQPGNDDPPLMTPPGDWVVHYQANSLMVPLHGISAGPYESGPVTVSAATADPQIVTGLSVDYAGGPEGMLTLALTLAGGDVASVTITLDDGVNQKSYTFKIYATQLPPLYLPVVSRQ